MLSSLSNALVATAVFAAALGILSQRPAQAQTQPAPTQTMKSLLAAGYDIKSVIAIEKDALPQYSLQAANFAQMLVTLQHDTSVATCVCAGTNWIYLYASTMENNTVCSVYSSK